MNQDRCTQISLSSSPIKFVHTKQHIRLRDCSVSISGTILLPASDDGSKIQIISSIQMHPPNPEGSASKRKKVLRRTVARAPPSKVPLHSGSDIFISTKDLINIYTPKPALYTARLADVIFGRDILMNSCVTRTQNTADLVPLDVHKLRSVIGKEIDAVLEYKLTNNCFFFYLDRAYFERVQKAEH